MQALLVSLSAPEMDRLAVELAARHSLVGLVRRYANKLRWWKNCWNESRFWAAVMRVPWAEGCHLRVCDRSSSLKPPSCRILQRQS